MLNFDRAQKKAIETVYGPVLCVAGPGSGKTTAMVHRVRHMIECENILPEHILVVTFTKAAALNMQRQFERICDSGTGVTFGTFHAVFFHILKTAYGYRGTDILKEDEKYGILRQLLSGAEFEYEDYDELIPQIIEEIGIMKSDMIPLEHFYSQTVGEEEFRAIYRELQSRVNRMGKLDFDDMMVYCLELLQNREDILKLLQNRYQYILVDEFQDINRIQYEITKLLAAPQNNLFIVGDDDQSIYGFRGSRPEIMLHFREDYPDASEISLNVNYRCSKNIVAGASRVIANNRLRFEKQLVSERDFEEPIHVHHVNTLGEEYDHIMEQLMRYKREGLPYREIALITRTNMQTRPLAHKLMAYNLPFQIRDNIPCIYDHFTVRTILDYIHAGLGRRDRALFLRIINKPKRYVPRQSLCEEEFSFYLMKERFAKQEWVADRLTQLEYELQLLKKLKPYAAVNFIRKSIGYDDYLAEYAKYRHISADELYQTLDELQELAKSYDSYEAWFEGMDAYREEFARHIRQNVKDKEAGITVTTMHSAKGLEFEAVFLLEANETLSPYKKAKKPEEIEEERRMFYVAMTRAKRHLHIYDVREYYNRKLEPSRFLEEIME